MIRHYGVILHTSRVLDNGYTRTTHSPTIFLDANVQGIVSVDHAERIAVRLGQEIAGEGVEVWAHAWDASAGTVTTDGEAE